MRENLRKVISRRNFFGLCGAGAGGLGYMHFGEAQWLEINERKAELTRGGAEVRILHLSDFHASSAVSLDFIREAVELGLSLKPDLVCLTGDFITNKYKDYATYASILRRFSETVPTFACMGNHDGGFWAKRWGYPDWKHVGKLLRDAQAQILYNAAHEIEVKGRRFQLVGVGDLWAKELDAKKAFSTTTKALKTILLSHNPDSKEQLGGYNWDLMLCGHTHGGQLRLPILGTPFAPVKDKRYVEGLKPWRDRLIHVSKGVGNLHGMRFNCRPEVSLLRVTV